MAQAFMKNTKLNLIYATGMNEKGEPTFKGKSYTNVRKEATADQLLQAATALGGLSEHPLSSVERTDNHDIF